MTIKYNAQTHIRQLLVSTTVLKAYTDKETS